jgi:hypothetical protein
MKFKVEGDRKEVINVCKEICKVKEEEEVAIKKKSMQIRATKAFMNATSKITGGLNYDDAFNSLNISYYEEKDCVVLDIPFYVPSLARGLMRRKLEKTFREIFEAACKKPVKVEFLNWGDK